MVHTANKEAPRIRIDARCFFARIEPFCKFCMDCNKQCCKCVKENKASKIRKPLAFAGIDDAIGISLNIRRNFMKEIEIYNKD